MKSRNLLNIFLLCCVLGLFLAFGVVVNAAESGDTVTYTYTASWSQYYNGCKQADYSLSVEKSFRFCLLKLDGESSGNELYQPYALNNNYFGNNYGDFPSVHGIYYNSDGSVSGERTDNYIGNWYVYPGTLNTNIPIFENTEKGLADAKNYLETGILPVKEGYDIYLDNLQVSDVIDDVVNITWDGYILDPALHGKSIVGYKVKRNVFPFIILSDGESDTGWQPWQSLPHYIDGKLKNADFIFSPSEPWP